ncbi:endolytic transglycosylase MltG [soil metagenome]
MAENSAFHENLVDNKNVNLLIKRASHYIHLSDFRKYYIALSFFILFLIAFITQQIFYSKYKWQGNAEKEYVLKPGSNLTEVSQELKSSGIIPNAFVFKMLGKVLGKENDIISRKYIFKSGSTNLDILRLITDKNFNQTVKLTIIEGLNTKRIGKIIETKLGLSAEKFIALTSDDSLIASLKMPVKVSSLEGFLYPETYDIPVEIDEKGLIKLFYSEFKKRVFENSEIMDSIKSKNLDVLKVITMASIVQGETRKNDEKATIAGVYYNRLKKNMKLEADPTVQYLLPGGWKLRLQYDDLKINSPYNTYIYKGLPPGPITNPDVSSIIAAVNPEKHNYIFFVATGEGGHKFTERYEDHLKAVEEYRQKMKEKAAGKETLKTKFVEPDIVK